MHKNIKLQYPLK